jgi:hypothetical protein
MLLERRGKMGLTIHNLDNVASVGSLATVPVVVRVGV